MSVDIIQGECRTVLAGLPADSVQTCSTSPPFYALRDYHLPPSVWGGDPGCVHDWGQWDEAHDERAEVAHGKTRTTERCYGEASRRFDGNHRKHTAGAFCRLCGAWRGCLGLEPRPDCGHAGRRQHDMELRNDLSAEERAYVIAELVRLGVIR